MRKATDAAGEVLREDKRDYSLSNIKVVSCIGCKTSEKVKQLDKMRDDISISMYGDPSLSSETWNKMNPLHPSRYSNLEYVEKSIRAHPDQQDVI